MAETERTFAALQALLADNTTKAISPMDLRDAVVSALGGYASIYVADNATPQTILATPTVIDAFAEVGVYRGATGSIVDDTITVGVAGDYEVKLTASVVVGAADDLRAQVFVDGVAADGLVAEATSVGVTDLQNVAIMGLVALTAGQVLDVRFSCGSTRSATIQHAHFSIKRAG